MKELNSETFKSLNELAEIQRMIAVARAEFDTLRSTKDTFLAEREAEVLQIVDNVLTASKEAITEAEANREAIASLLATVTEFVQVALTMQKDLADGVVAYETATNKTMLVIKSKTEKLEEQFAELKQRRRKVEDDEKAIALAREAIARDRMFIADRKQMLDQELKRIQSIK